MNPVLVRLSAVVALTVPLAAYPALLSATPDPQVAFVHALLTVEPIDAGPHPEEPATPPSHETDDGGEMEGMDHSDPTGSEHGESSDGHTDQPAPTPVRPRVPVVSAFGGLNAVVLVGAAMLRRRDRARPRHRPRARTGTDSRRMSR